MRLTGLRGRPALYLLVPRLVGELPAGKRWVRVSTTDLLKLAGPQTGALGHLATMLNPTLLLRLLGSIAGSPTRVGPTMISGHLTERYHLSINLAALATRSGLPTDMQNMLSGLKPVSLDAWIDERDGYLRQLQIASQASGPAPARFVLVLQLHDFGSPVHVAPPPAAATISAAELTARLHA